MSIGKNIKRRRKQLGISAETLAERLGIAASTMYRYESGAIEKVDSTIIPAIAEILRTTPAALMGWESDSPSVVPGVNYPDIDKAATTATEMLIRYRVGNAPVMPMLILKSMPSVFLVTFTEFAGPDGMDAGDLALMYGSETQDVVTLVKEVDGERRYVVAYNQRMPFYLIHRAMARELGHIVLGHDGSNKDAQSTEALYFARHLLCPRPLVKSLMDSGIQLTVETVGNLTGCYGRSIACMAETPGATVPAKLNRKLREQFSDYVAGCLRYSAIMSESSSLADFGTYMDNYAE